MRGPWNLNRVAQHEMGQPGTHRCATSMIYSPVQEHMRKSILEYLDVLESDMSAEIQQLKLRHGGLMRLPFLLLDSGT